MWHRENTKLPTRTSNTILFIFLATDFVGLSTTSASDAIIIDTTPPTVSDVYTLDVGGSSFLLSKTSVSLR